MTISVRALRARFLEGRPHLPRTVAVVLITLSLAVLLGQQPSVLYVMAPILLVGLWVLSQNQPVGLLAVLISAMVIPFALGTGTQTSLPLAYILIPVLLAAWLIDRLRLRSFRLVPSRTTLPLVGLVVAASLAMVYGNLPLVAQVSRVASLRSQLGAWGVFAFSAGAFILVANQIRDPLWLKRMVWVFVGLGAIYIAGRAVPGAQFILSMFVNSATGSVFWIWLVALAGGQVLFNSDLRLRWKVALVFLVTATLGVGLAPDARDWASGWIPATIALAVLVFLRWPRLGFAFGLLGVAIGLLKFQAIQQFLLTPDNQYSLITRAAALDIVLQIIRSNPVLGVGPANYYWYTPLYPILGYYVRFNSHNQYIDILAQTGVVGMSFVLWFFAAVGRLGWQLRNRLADGFSKAYVHSCLAGAAGMLVAGLLGDWFLPFVYNIGIAGFRASVLGWLFLGGLVALEQMRSRAGAHAPGGAAGTA